MELSPLIELLSGNIIMEIAVVIILATILSFFVRLFKQPLIPAYIITGLLLGPIGLGLIKDPVAVRTLSELGISFLLFIVHVFFYAYLGGVHSASVRNNT